MANSIGYSQDQRNTQHWLMLHTWVSSWDLTMKIFEFYSICFENNNGLQLCTPWWAGFNAHQIIFSFSVSKIWRNLTKISKIGWIYTQKNQKNSQFLCQKMAKCFQRNKHWCPFSLSLFLKKEKRNDEIENPEKRTWEKKRKQERRRKRTREKAFLFTWLILSESEI